MTQAWAGTSTADDGDDNRRAAARSSARHGGLVGRDAELHILDDLLARSDVRLVTVVGLAGVGKSRLATEAVDRVAHGGRPVMRVDLAGVTDARLLGDVVSAGTDEPRAPGLVPGATDALWERFGGEPVVVLLDHLDEVEDPGDTLRHLLDGYPLLQVLATAIRPLHLAGEHVLRLAPFAAAEDPADDPGVTLFLARASAADVAFHEGTADIAVVQRVVQACGGLPLAIELAAARVASVPPAAMAVQLDAVEAADVLHGGGDVPERRRSVSGALAWTVDLLSPGARQTLEDAAVFAGAATLDALASVAVPTVAAAELLDRVAELVDVQLVALDPTGTGVIAVRLTPLVRSFALSRLRASGRENQVRDAHAAYFRDACRTDPDVVRRAWPDVLAAIDHSMLNGRSNEALHAAVIAATSAGHVPGAEATLLPRLDALLADGSDADPGLRVRALLWSAAHTPADSEAMSAHGEHTRLRLAEAVSLSRAAGDQRGLLEALETTVRSLGITLDLEGAVAAAYEGLRLSAQLGDIGPLGRFEVYSAMAAGSAGDVQRAVGLAESALGHALEVDDPVTIAYAATLLRLAGAPTAHDVPAYPELVRRCEEDGAPFAALHVLAAMTLDSFAAGDLPGASALIARQLVIAVDHGRSMPFGGIAALAMLTQVALLRGELEDGVRLAEGLAPQEAVMVTSIPTLMGPFTQARDQLRALVPAARHAELAAEVATLTLLDVLRLGVPLAQAWSRPPTAAAAPAQPRPRTPDVRLTPREHDVLLEMARGGTNAEIADRLGLTTKTVMHHSVAIYRKLDVRGRTEATAWAFRSGLVDDGSAGG